MPKVQVLLEDHSDRVDDLIQQLVKDAPAGAAALFAICALGGYGRRTMCLHSDVDLLIVFDGRIRTPEEQLVKALLHPLWDLGFTVGHQVRELADLDFFDDDNPEFLLALLDVRLLAGSREIFDAVSERREYACEQRAAAVRQILQTLIARRHASYNNTLYHLEPDIKEAPGGLRDAVAVQWLHRLDRRTSSVLAEGMREAEEFLLQIRSVLHSETRRNSNILTHALQERVATALGYRGTITQQVEALMGDYFRHARVIARTLECAQHPECVRFGEPVVPSGGVDILAALRPTQGLYDRINDFRHSGLLGQLFPEFQKIHCRVIRDFHHKYTVDEHTLLTLRSLESLLEPATASRERFGQLLRELRSPELLSLALLFHDVGKWQDGDHAAESVRMVRPVLDRLALPSDARQLVEFLIAQHLQMSRVALRRDSEDPEVVRDFAARVGTEERLKMLCLMTLADIEAVGPETLTPWKEELLWRLYVDTYNCLTLAYADDLIDDDPGEAAALVDSLPDDIDAVEFANFLLGLPKRYLALFDAEHVYRHVRLARNIHRDEVHSTLECKNEVWELTVVTLDKPYLFANISGVLSYFGMDILRAQAMTTPQGLVVDVFAFADAGGFLRCNPGAPQDIVTLLDDVVAGRADVDRLLRAKEHRVFYRPGVVVPLVHFDDEHSRKYTVLEIVADDGPGLLHRIGRVISDQRCAVHLALISTEGRKAIDVLHVTKDRQKLSPDEREGLQHALVQSLDSRAAQPRERTT